MATMESLFGLMADEIVDISYVDAKLFIDQSYEWRIKCRSCIADIKKTRDILSRERHLHQRTRLNILRLFYEDLFQSHWRIYRDVQSAAHRVSAAYLLECDRRSAVYCRLKA